MVNSPGCTLIKVKPVRCTRQTYFHYEYLSQSTNPGLLVCELVDVVYMLSCQTNKTKNQLRPIFRSEYVSMGSSRHQ